MPGVALGGFFVLANDAARAVAVLDDDCHWLHATVLDGNAFADLDLVVCQGPSEIHTPEDFLAGDRLQLDVVALLVLLVELVVVRPVRDHLANVDAIALGSCGGKSDRRIHLGGGDAAIRQVAAQRSGDRLVWRLRLRLSWGLPNRVHVQQSKARPQPQAAQESGRAARLDVQVRVPAWPEAGSCSRRG